VSDVAVALAALIRAEVEPIRAEVALLAAEVAALRAPAPSVANDLDTAKAAEMAGVTPATIREWVRERGLPAARPGGRALRIRRADLLAFLDSARTAAVDIAAEAERLLRRP
jgi:excisionase family DNA binding protein